MDHLATAMGVDRDRPLEVPGKSSRLQAPAGKRNPTVQAIRPAEARKRSSADDEVVEKPIGHIERRMGLVPVEKTCTVWLAREATHFRRKRTPR